MEVAPSGKLAPAMAARQGSRSCSGSVGPVPGVAQSLPMSLPAFYPTRLGAQDVRPVDSYLIASELYRWDPYRNSIDRQIFGKMSPGWELHNHLNCRSQLGVVA